MDDDRLAVSMDKYPHIYGVEQKSKVSIVWTHVCDDKCCDGCPCVISSDVCRCEETTLEADLSPNIFMRHLYEVVVECRRGARVLNKHVGVIK